MLTPTKALSGFVFLATALSAFANPMTQAEREHVVAHLEMTQAWLTGEVSSLSAAQLNFRPGPDRWTVAEVVQHLVISEPNYWKLLHDALKQPPKKLPEQATDADVLWYGIDRTQHEKTPSNQNPKGQDIDTAQALKAFLGMHAQLLQMARSTDEDLRGHAVPEWGVDAYQCLLEISTHEQRHILQIREIKASAAFPKN
jgi:DinB superfamily